ncbi:MAG: pyridoxal-phosphate dependent enzyme [Pseudomonadota bacterium]
MTKDQTDLLFEEILRARTRVYRAGAVTPQQEIPSPGDYKILVKREDLGPINAYKWRGAYNAVSVYHAQTQCETVVAASAGNHAQGVALAAKKLGLNAKIFMPLSAPQMKQQSVKRHGGAAVEIILVGDTYNEAADAAKEYAAKHALICIHPFDDIYTMAGQATIADEIVLSGTIPDIVFLQIGGGGMAGAVACWLKKHHPHIRIIGVEGIDQASMIASIKAGKPVTLDKVDTFCDGTAVTRPGDLTFAVCQQYIDDYITVTNEEVSAAIQRMWEASRIIPEPSGAMGLAGLVQYAEAHAEQVAGKTLLCICCGANMDFGKLAMLSQKSAIGAHRRRYLRFHIGEKRGGMLELLDNHFKGLTVSEFLYGKTHESEAWPIIALEADPARMEHLDEELTRAGVEFEDVTFDADVQYKVINYNPALFKHPLLLLIQFPERKGALRDFMRKASEVSNVCYFNYTYSGEAVGRSLMGFEFDTAAARDGFLDAVKDTPVNVFPVDPATTKRILEY